MSKINYWTWKDSQVVDELSLQGLELAEYDRKIAIDMLKKNEKIQAAKVMVEEDDDGKIAPAVIEQLKKEVDLPVLMLSRIIFHSTSETDLPYVPMGHNGRAFYVPKEMEIDVPDYLLDSCIKDAVEYRMFPQVQRDGTIEWMTRKVQRFPYSIIKRSFPAE